MKKILSFVLVLAMIASMMCINVAAAEEYEANPNATTHSIVGTAPVQNANGAGVTGAQANGSHSYNVDAILGAYVKNRYAVDIQYKTSDVTLTGDAVWNVNTLNYEGNITVKALDSAVISANDPEATVKVGEFTITNYSDLSVKATVVGASTLGAYYEGITTSVEVVNDSSYVEFAQAGEVLDGAYNATTDGEDNDATSLTFHTFVTATDWAYAVAQLSSNNTAAQNAAYDLATFTISVAPATNNYSQD